MSTENIKNLSSIATELITGEYISPNDYEEPQYSLVTLAPENLL